MGGAESISRQKLTERIKETKQTLDKEITKQTERVNEMKNTNPYLLDLLLENLSYSLKSHSNFSEDTLIASWIANNTKCEQLLIETFEYILKPPIDTKEYLWFTKTIVNSPILLLTNSTNNGYLYEKLLEIATKYAMETEVKMNKLYNDLKSNKLKWNELQNIKNESLVDRQDDIAVDLLNNKKLYDLSNIESKYNEDDDNEQKHYIAEFIDIHMAINELVAVASNLNDEFQEYINNIMKDLGEFHAGPIKTYQRCQAKVQNDYGDELYPHSAKLLDLIRCSLTFDNVSKMLIGYKYFIDFCNNNKDKIEIGRIKNGFFIELNANNGGYRDIKVNVIYKSDKYKKNMICEVQFILRPFLIHKKKAHKLYMINRQKIYFEMASNAYYGTMDEIKSNDIDTGVVGVGAMQNISKIYETVNFERYGTTTGEMHCSISSKCGVVASYNASEHEIVINDFKNKEFCYKIIAAERRSRMIANGSLFAFVEKKRLSAIAICNEAVFKKDLNDEDKKIYYIDFSEMYYHAEIYNFNIDQIGNKLVVIGRFDDNIGIMVYQKFNDKWKQIVSKFDLDKNTKITSSCKMSVSPNGDYVSIANGWINKYFLHISIKNKTTKKYEIKECVGSMASCYFNDENEKNQTLLICAGCKKKAPFQSIISVWNINDNDNNDNNDNTKPIKQIILDEEEGQIRCLISKSSLLIAASGIVNKFSKIKVWDLKTWKMIYNQQIAMNIVNYLAPSEDGKYLAISGNGENTLIVLRLM